MYPLRELMPVEDKPPVETTNRWWVDRVDQDSECLIIDLVYLWSHYVCPVLVNAVGEGLQPT